MLTFPLQMALMSDRSFPLALPGLVHVRNRIEVLRADRRRRAARPRGLGRELRPAPQRRGGRPARHGRPPAAQEVWRSTSTYLARGAKAPEGAPEADIEVAVGDLERVAATWRIPDDAGRRYAKVSGDVNPIHLSGLTAKAFGFKRAIAHGMWVKARVLGALSGRLPDDAEPRRQLPQAAVPAVDGHAVDGAGRRRLGLRRPQRGERHRARRRDHPPALISR